MLAVAVCSLPACAAPAISSSAGQRSGQASWEPHHGRGRVVPQARAPLVRHTRRVSLAAVASKKAGNVCACSVLLGLTPQATAASSRGTMEPPEADLDDLLAAPGLPRERRALSRLHRRAPPAAGTPAQAEAEAASPTADAEGGQPASGRAPGQQGTPSATASGRSSP